MGMITHESLGAIAGPLAFGSSAVAGEYHAQSMKGYELLDARRGGLYLGQASAMESSPPASITDGRMDSTPMLRTRMA